MVMSEELQMTIDFMGSAHQETKLGRKDPEILGPKCFLIPLGLCMVAVAIFLW